MRVVVLGAAAGGGFPQWNSNAAGCRRARAGDPAARPRTQASLAVSADGKSWTLLNAAPDLRQQIERTKVLHPNGGLRSSPIASVVLTGGDVDAIAGLLTLRERQPFGIYATARVHEVLHANPIFEVLSREIVRRQVVPLDQPWPIGGLSSRVVCGPGQSPALSRGRPDAGHRGERSNRRRRGLGLHGHAVLYSGLCRHDPVAGEAPAWGGAGHVRWHALARRRDDRAGLGPKTGGAWAT